MPIRMYTGAGADRLAAHTLLIALLTMLCVASFALRPAPARAADDRALRSVDGRRTRDGWVVELRFSTPLRYIGHSPRGKADSVLIDLQSVGVSRADDGPADARESVRPFPGGQGPPVMEVSTDAPTSGRGLVVEVRFSRSVDFEIRQGSDLQRLELLVPETAATGDPKQEAAAATLLQTANRALAESNPQQAAQIYTRILSLDAPSAHPEALEKLGLARERSGQRAHARAEYESFLERYPDDERAPLVRQRLQALTTASSAARADRQPSRRTRDGMRVDVHGGLLSYYSRAESFYGDDIGDQLHDSSWFTDIYLRGRMRTEGYDLEASASGRTRLDFRDDELGNDSRLSSLLVEASQRGQGWWGNVGRQRGDAGVIGRFDGARLGFRPTDRLDFQVLGGFPLESYSSNAINTDRFQVGGAGQVLDLFSFVDLEIYGNYQNEDDLTYRAAIGAELRHLRPGRTVVASLDYDAYFNVVNIAMLLANVQVTDQLSLNTLIEYRKSPIVTLGNALIGQLATSVGELQETYSIDEMKSLAEDRSADYTTLSFGGRYDINQRFDVSGSFTASKLSGTPASGGVPALPSAGFEFGYYAQLGTRSLLMDRDTTVLGIRIFDGGRYNRYSLLASGRYPVWSRLRLNPILSLEFQDADVDFVRLVPRLRLDYSWWALMFDVDFAFEWARGLGESDRPQEYGYSLVFGVRYDF